MEAYEAALVGIVATFAMIIGAYFVRALVRDMQTPVTVNYNYTPEGRIATIVVT